ncbi:AraC family transcriptional regulator [Candidatus Magnetomorum sp. HK-1]|nr:AraC family transcriptional regulator [Candidatus Magnetomorum sp. HK-1]
MRKITIFLTENAMLSSLAIPLDVFKAAGVFWNMLYEKKTTPLFDVKIATIDGKPVKTYFGHELKPDISIQDADKSDTIIIPPSDASDILEPKAVSWLIESYEKGAHIASICLGAFLLAQTGLLENKTATTHWGYMNRFRKQFPKIKLKPEKLITDEGDIFTAGGANAGGDLALYLIAKYAGKEAAFQTARIMVMDMDRKSQSPYLLFRFEKIHGDKDVLNVQNWLEKNFNNEVSVALLADKAGMSRRTFERRFKKATGDSPLQYLQRIRIENAKQLLERGGKTFDEITYMVGYEDSSTFSRFFKKTTGLSPVLYKKKYSIKI